MTRRIDNLDLAIRRRRAGVEQQQLAVALGVDQAALSRFETNNGKLGRNLSRVDYIAALEKLAGEGARK